MAKKSEETAGVGENALLEIKEGELLPQGQDVAQAPSEPQEGSQEPRKVALATKMLRHEWSDDEINEHMMAGGQMLEQPVSYDIEELAQKLKKWEKPNLAALVGATIVGVAESPEGAVGVIVVDANQITKTVAWFTKEPMNPEPGFAFFTPYHK